MHETTNLMKNYNYKCNSFFVKTLNLFDKILKYDYTKNVNLVEKLINHRFY